MNKLLLTIVVIIYSENIKANEYLPNESIETPLYYIEKEYAPTCFYSKPNFQGKSVCLNTIEIMDLYNDEFYGLNDHISSIEIPKGVQVTIYKHDSFNSPHYNLTESIDIDALEEIEMAGNISSIAVKESPGYCHSNCVILSQQLIYLNSTFNKHYSILENTSKLVLMNFEIKSTSDFSVGFIQSPFVSIVGNKLFFYTARNLKPIFIKLNDNTDNLSLLFKINGQQLQFQYLEAKGTQAINTPFWINTKFPYKNLPNLYIDNSIYNKNHTNKSEAINPLILKKAILALNKHSHRDKRGALGVAGCFGIPLLAIYNFVVQGYCNQLDKLVGVNEFAHHDGTSKTTVVAGPTNPLPVKELEKNSEADNPSLPVLALTHINTHLHNQALTLPAAARVCNTPIENIIGTRYPRQTGMRCGSRLSMLLADFTLLFGESLLNWTTEHLTQTLQSINEHDTTGYAGSDQATESRLVERVQQAISDLGIRQLTEMLQDAFNDAVVNYTQYLMQNEEQGSLATPQAAQDLPLGGYTLFLGQYTHPEELPAPLIMDNGQWIRPDDLYFEVSVIPGGDHHLPTNLTDEILEVVDNWRIFYNQVGYEMNNLGNPLTSQDRTIYAARVTSHVLSNLLSANSSDYQFVIVKLKGKIISVLASQNDENGEDSYLNFSVTAPQYVLTPNENGSVRGAGTAAVRELARYLKEKGKKTLSADVISHPSAKVKLKIGFVHKDEL